MSCSSNRRVGADSVYPSSPSPPPQPSALSPSSFATNDTFVASPYINSGMYPSDPTAATSSSNLKFREFRRLDDVPVGGHGHPQYPHHGQVTAAAYPFQGGQQPPQGSQFPYQRNHFPWARSDSTERLTEVMSD